MIPLAPHLTAFLREWLPLQRGASPHTCESYAYTFQLLLTYASQRLHQRPSDLCLEHLDAPMVMEFLAYLEAERGNRPSTRNTRLAAITSFMRFVEYRVPSILEQSRRILAIPTKKTALPLVKHFAMAEMHALLDAPDIRTRAGIRDRAMLHLCFAAGLRVSELLTVPLTAVTFHPAPTIQVLGKGRRERSLPLWKQTADDLQAWLAVRGDVGIPELFLNAQDRVMTREGFAYVLRKYVRLAAQSCPSLEKQQVSPHVLRHTCAMMILQATGDLRKVSLWLGHADMQTTEVYLRADPTDKIDAIEAVMPPALRRGHFTVPDKLIASLRGE
jgi:integrase/recombinase XerD